LRLGARDRLRCKIGKREPQLRLRSGLGGRPIERHGRFGNGQFQLVGKIGGQCGFGALFGLEGRFGLKGRGGDCRLDASDLRFYDRLDHRFRIEDVVQILQRIGRRRGRSSRDGLGRERCLVASQRRIINLELAQQLVFQVELRLFRFCGARRRGVTLNGRLEADDPGQFRQRIIVRETIAP